MHVIQKLSSATIVIVAIVALFTLLPGKVVQAKGGPPRCPKIYAPVICDGDKIFPNQCEADRRHATNCVPLGL